MNTRVVITQCVIVVFTAAMCDGFGGRASGAIVSPTAQKAALATHAEASSSVAAPIVDNDAGSAGDFNPYNSIIESQATIGPPASANAIGGATQTSSLLPSQINCGGTSEASILTQFNHFPEINFQSHAEASANSTCEVSFTVDEASDWRLSGLLTSDFAGSIAEVTLRIDGGATLFTAFADFDNNVELMPFDVTQSLLPGNVYNLAFTSDSAASGVGGEEVDEFIINTTGSYNGQMVLVPEPTTLALLALLVPFQARRRR